MKKISKIPMVLLIIGVILALVNTVSAATVGDTYAPWGVNLGYVLIILAVIVAAVGYAAKAVEAVQNPMYVIAVILLIVGILCAGIPLPADVTDDDAVTASVQWDVDESALTTQGTYYPDTTFEEYTGGGGQFTVPYAANKTSNALYEDGDNSSYSDDPVIQFVCEPDAPEGTLTTEMFTIYFEVTNPNLYCGSDADNRVITKTNDIVQLTWTDDDANTDMVSGWVKTTANDPVTINLTMNLYEAGLSEAVIFQPNTLQLRLYNAAGTWSEVYTVSFILSAYWGA